MEKVIFHIDVNSAFLSWEAVYRLKHGETLDLREIPSAVGGDREKRGRNPHLLVRRIQECRGFHCRKGDPRCRDGTGYGDA